MFDKNLVGHSFGRRSILVETGAVQNYAHAIGETNPVFRDPAAARDAGYPSVRVPPAFFFCLESRLGVGADARAVVNFDTKRILHAEQSFVYHAPAFAGDTLTFETHISDIYDKKGGALEFIVTESRVTNQDGVHVADVRKSLVQRQL
ncbi:MaoC family dehydratase N-terminal domain-containing protein [Cupriavidus alkaliphilus]|uniref:MaoC family dehydratase N-terminal domain-containing protein n=1 Tax=Cupriavidus alkaliphilus TaxID=942866 RepID=UPI00161BCA27|nr:MaoC family dehydratase N-terminal domain-containing protein [Cupriavidus alkaliphilus]MBB2919338.1 acyl dehydratase [Cupriavidus alkaliphilus]